MKPYTATRRFRCDPLLLAVAAMVWALLCTASLVAQQPKLSEYQVKAAYIYNFSRFVKWPVKAADQESTFAICILGQDPFGPILDSILAGKVLDGKPVIAKRISKPQDAANCRIVFINSDQGAHLKEILTTLNQASVLTVSDMPDFTRRGGIIQFVLEENKVRFEINLAGAEGAALIVSSELLKVASSVTRSAGPGD